jgi:hypothetical protein
LCKIFGIVFAFYVFITPISGRGIHFVKRFKKEKVMSTRGRNHHPTLR